MTSSYWIKLYSEMLDDPKIYKLRPELRWRFIECLLVAGEQKRAGKLLINGRMAWRLRSTEEEIEQDLQELGEAGLLEMVEGCWRVKKFSKRQARQYSKNPEAVRKRKYREQQRKERKEPKERKEIIKDIDEDKDKDMSHGTRPWDMSHKNVPINNNGIDPLMKPGIDHLVEWWLNLVGGSLPADTETRRSKLYEPAQRLLSRLEGNVPEAKELLTNKRHQLLSEGKTPKWLEAVSYLVIADNDKPATRDWTSDFKVFETQP